MTSDDNRAERLPRSSPLPTPPPRTSSLREPSPALSPSCIEEPDRTHDTSMVTDAPDDPEALTSSAPRDKPPRRPLIDLVKNNWQSHHRYDRLSGAEDESSAPGWKEMLRTPRLRRYLLVYLFLIVSCVVTYEISYKRWLKPYWREQEVLSTSLKEVGRLRFGWYGANTNPKFTDLIQVGTLPKSFLPHETSAKHDHDTGTKRLIFVGDVHGCRTELMQLLDNLSFNEDYDHLVLTGDLIAKGPDSAGVVDLVSSLNASCVRGNHDDRVLLAYRSIHASRVPSHFAETAASTADDDSPTSPDSIDYPDTQTKHGMLARQLSPLQAAYLSACPIVLDVGSIPGMGKVLTAHGGLVPGLDARHQDPTNVMTMRSVDLDTHVPSDTRNGMPWTKLWNHYERYNLPSKKQQHTTVVYGHDSHLGLQMKKYSKGLDTGCVAGGRLTAWVLEGKPGSKKVKQKVVSVKCKNYRVDKKKAG